ncbi:MAG TPA: hypothetical protein VJN19_04910, partial [Propionibacteriaceae bacterium]|nr:hypothetical protein [Propionibacteriaceae bacterium]
PAPGTYHIRVWRCVWVLRCACHGSLVSADRGLHSEHVPSRTALRLALPRAALLIARHLACGRPE